MAETSCFSMSVHRSEGQKTQGKQNTDLLDYKYFLLYSFFQFLEFFKFVVTYGAVFLMHSITSEN